MTLDQPHAATTALAAAPDGGSECPEEESEFVQLAADLGFDEWRIRDAPSLDALELGWIERGDIVRVLERADVWSRVHVESTDLEGWTLAVKNGRRCFAPAPPGGRNWAVLVCGGTRASYYGVPSRPWMDLGGEISLLITLGHVYAQLEKELGSDHVVVIAGLASARNWLASMARDGYSKPVDPRHEEASKAFYGDLEASRRKWKARWQELEYACAALIARGGADYDGRSVNPTTVLAVLSGHAGVDGGEGGRGGGHVIPRRGVSSIFLWVTTHGSAHPISIDVERTPDGRTRPVPIADEAVCEASSSLDANEWFWIMPHQATDPSAYGFVRLAGYTIDPEADPAEEHPHLPLFVVYWQQVFQVLHGMLRDDPGRRVVAFYQFCLAGGHLSFLERPAIREHYGVDRWPIHMIASAAANQNSLGATLTNIFLEELSAALEAGGYERLGLFFRALERRYWQQHTKVAQMNRHLPEHMRMGEVRQYHTPGADIQDTPVRAVFSNRRLPRVHTLSAREPVDLAATPSSEPSPKTLAAAADYKALLPEAREELVNLIVEMGFDRALVLEAMADALDQPDLAIDLLLGGQLGG